MTKTKKNRILKILLAVCITLALAFAAFTVWLPSFVMTGERQTLEEAFQWQTEHYDTAFYEDLEKVDYTVSGYEDYTLHVELLKNPASAGKYIILSHGYGDNRIGSLKYVPIYLNLGYHCIIYDLRGHGENERTFTTYGIREAQDLTSLIEDTRSRYDDLTVLGLHGESLGAATTITALKYKPDVDFAVADCGFSDIENVLKTGYRSAHLPEAIFDLADFGARIRYHYSLKDMRPVDSLDDNTIPILFLHGEEDRFILPKNSMDMAQRTKGRYQLHLVPGAGHAQSVLAAPEQYQQYVRDFTEELGT